MIACYRSINAVKNLTNASLYGYTYTEQGCNLHDRILVHQYFLFVVIFEKNIIHEKIQQKRIFIHFRIDRGRIGVYLL